MINRALHFITNRTTFSEPSFVGDPSFSPAQETKDTRELRRLLSTSDDYHARAMLVATEAIPTVAEEYRESMRSYRAYDFDRPPVYTSGAVWVFDEKGFPFFSPNPEEIPIPHEMTLSYEPGGAVLAYGASRVRISCRQADDTIYPAWPASFGAGGGLKLDFAWLPGARVVVQGYPVRYPWRRLGEMLVQSQACQNLLQKEDLGSYFFNAGSPVEKVAIVCLSLARQHPNFND